MSSGALSETRPCHRRNAFFLFGGVLLVRILVVLLCPTDLAGDEAYYWEWGQHPAWGYYSKPPGIAWIMAVAGWLGGNSVIGIRLTAVAFSMGTGVWIYLLCRALFDERAALIGAAVFFVTPAAAGLSFLLTIDSPLMFFWSGALYFFFRVIHADGRRYWLHLLGLAVCIACGVLVKQMMMVFPLIAVVTLLLRRKSSTQPVKIAPLIAALFLPLLILIPTLQWNAEHDWPTLRHTGEHFARSAETGIAEALSRLGEFAGSQFLIASPVVAGLLFWLLFRQAGNRNRTDRQNKDLWWFCAPGLVAMFIGTLWQRINPNWPAVFYLAGLVLVAGWISAHLPTKSARRWYRAALICGVSITAILYASLALTSWRMGPRALQVQSQRLHGWSQLASEVQKWRASCPDPDNTIVITRSHRFLTSQLAFQLPGHPRVYRYAYTKDEAIDSQHAFWPGLEAVAGRDALIVSVGTSGRLPSALSRRFEVVEKIAAIEGFDAIAGGPISIFLGRNLMAPGEDIKSELTQR